MTLKYYMRPDSNTPPQYGYVVGPDTDSLWNPDTCIEVPEQPTSNHEYDFDTSAWVLNETYYMTDLRGQRDRLLSETDRYVLPDYPISEADLIIIKAYRQDLRDCPNAELIADRVLPDCPEICK